MMLWIKRIARIMSILSFFIVFFLGIDPTDPFNVTVAFIAIAKGFAGALLFWVAGFVVADIIIKGLVMDVRANGKDPMEGGLIQRLHTIRSSLSPDANRPDDGPDAEIGKTDTAQDMTKANKTIEVREKGIAG